MEAVTWIAVGWAAFASLMSLLLLGALLGDRKERNEHRAKMIGHAREAADAQARLDMVEDRQGAE